MHKNIRTLLCLSLVLCLMLPTLSPVLAAKKPAPKEKEEIQAEEAQPDLHISTVQQFLNFAENCRLDSYSEDLWVVLEQDLDLSHTAFEGIPIFKGRLDGQGHMISGLNLTGSGSHLGLIRFLQQGAAVENLKVRGRVTPEGSQTCIGGIVGTNSGTLENCQFEGSLAAKDSVGGIAGQNTVTGIITGCRSQGEISAEHRIGGIAGENSGVIADCKNDMKVNTSSQDNIVQVTSITIDTLKGTEDPHTVTDVGGITGMNTGVIRDCINRGDVGYLHMGYNIGGIAGSHSGYIAGCKNYGSIYGRKEAGGIVGQFIPTLRVEYSEDTLQILNKQLQSASSSLSQASYNAQSSIGAVGDGIVALKDQSEAARDALKQMLKGVGSLDPDQILAAHGTLTQNLQDMRSTVGYIGQGIQGTAGQLASDLKAVSRKISAMSQTLRNAEETTGVSLKDVSDQDTPEDLTGKVEQCANYGSISGDLNAGGIAGSIAFESPKDPEEDIDVQGRRSLNADGELRAVVLSCENRGRISGKKAHTGGIAGLTTMGLIRDCVSTGSILAEKAQYVGGIAGQSQGYIRSCHVKSKISGSSYVGGIAGCGTVVTDCLSMVIIEDAAERQGAILGAREPARDEKITEPLKDNFYMSLTKDAGAIDGISYRGLAEPMSPTVFISQEDLPQAFQKAVLTFCYEDGTQKELVLPVGSTLKNVQIPILPRKDGFTASWEGLDSYSDTRIYFDACFRPVYEPDRVTIRSLEERENGRPVFLAEGIFPELDHIAVEALEAPELDPKTALEAWTLPVFSRDSDTILHYTMPEDRDPAYLQVMVRDAEGAWRQAEFTVNASSLIFTVHPGDNAAALLELPNYRPLCYILGGAALILLLPVLLRIRKQRKKKKASQQKAS